MADRAQSHLDTTVGFVFLHVSPGNTSGLLDLLEEARAHRKSSLQEREHFKYLLREKVHEQHFDLLVHEGAHLLQALTHPALFLRCQREFSAVTTVIDELRKIDGKVPLPLRLETGWSTELGWSALPLRVEIDAAGLPSVEPSESRWPMPNDLSEVDLLEGSASICEFKVSVGGDGSSKQYEEWLGERYRYPKVFRYVAKLLSPEDAYVALPGLVMTAHESNWPVHAFISLLAMTIKEAPVPPARMGVDRYRAFLEQSFAESLAAGPPPDPRGRMEDQGEQRRIDREGMLDLAARIPTHPLVPLVERAWGKKGEVERLRDAVLHPAKAFDRRENGYRDWMKPYRPPVTAIRVYGEGFGPSDTTLEISDLLLEREPPEGFPTWPDFLVELIRIKSFVFSAATEYNSVLEHNCPHERCAFHRFDMCRTWLNIPERSRDCNFPKWVEKTASRRLNFMTGELEPTRRGR